MKDKIQLAHHEAGHVVIGMIVRRPIINATIKPGKDKISYVGCVQFDSYPVYNNMEVHILTAMIAIAGIVAEGIYLGEHIDLGSATDIKDLYKCANSLNVGEDEIKVFTGWIFERTKSHLKKCWPQVQILAAALVEKETLSKDEIEFILGIKKRG